MRKTVVVGQVASVALKLVLFMHTNKHYFLTIEHLLTRDDLHGLPIEIFSADCQELTHRTQFCF